MQLGENRPMRRLDRAVTDRAQIEEILRHCFVCHVALSADPVPYIVPLHFGYRWDETLPVFYFHSARTGRKIELLQTRPLVGFELDWSLAPEGGELPCSWSAQFASLIGEGRLEEVRDPGERLEGLRLLMGQYQFPGELRFDPQALETVAVLRMTVTALSAKQHGPVE